VTAGTPRREGGTDAVDTPLTDAAASADPTAASGSSVGEDDPNRPDVAAATPGGRTTSPATVRFSGRQVVEWAGLLGGALLIALLIRTFLFQPFYIPSASMYPTLKVNDRVLVNKVSYKVHDVRRGDIIVFNAPEGEASSAIKDLIKRVVALPGETVEGRGGHVYIGGQLLQEPYLTDGVVTSDFGPEKIPAASVWMMGDNRTQSRDSRYFGPIPESDIIGRAFVRLWPLSRLGFL